MCYWLQAVILRQVHSAVLPSQDGFPSSWNCNMPNSCKITNLKEKVFSCFADVLSKLFIYCSKGKLIF